MTHMHQNTDMVDQNALNISAQAIKVLAAPVSNSKTRQSALRTQQQQQSGKVQKMVLVEEVVTRHGIREGRDTQMSIPSGTQGSSAANNNGSGLRVASNLRIRFSNKQQNLQHLTIVNAKPVIVENRPFRLTQMQEKSNTVTLTEEQQSSNKFGQSVQTLDKSQSTFRRTNFRVRVENVIDEAGKVQKMNKAAAENVSNPDDSELKNSFQKTVSRVGEEKRSTSIQLRSTAKRFASVIKNPTDRKVVHTRVNSQADKLSAGQLGVVTHTTTAVQTLLSDFLETEVPVKESEVGGDNMGDESEPNSREVRQRRIYKESQRCFEQSARLAEKMNNLPKVSASRIQRQFEKRDSVLSYRKSSFYSSKRSPNLSLGNISYHINSPEMSPTNAQQINSYRQYQQDPDESALSQEYPNYFPPVTALAGASAMSEQVLQQQPVTSHAASDSAMQPLHQPLLHLALGSVGTGSCESIDQTDSMKQKAKFSDLPGATARKKQIEADYVKPNVLTGNIFSEQQTHRAKRIFMNRLTDYLGAQSSNRSGYDVSTLGMEKQSPRKQHAQIMDQPFFLMKRKKSVPVQQKEYVPDYQLLSYRNLQNTSQATIQTPRNQPVQKQKPLRILSPNPNRLLQVASVTQIDEVVESPLKKTKYKVIANNTQCKRTGPFSPSKLPKSLVSFSQNINNIDSAVSLTSLSPSNLPHKFAQNLAPIENDKNIEKMNEYVGSLQREFSQSAIALSQTLMSNERKIQSKKDDFAPKRRVPHAYMHDRPMEAPDTISLAYPHHNRYGGSSIFFASLTSSVHNMNGTLKNAHMMRSELGSMQDSMSDMMGSVDLERIIEDPQEAQRYARQKSREQRRNQTEKKSVVDKLKRQVSTGELRQEDFQNRVGLSKKQLRISRIENMINQRIDQDKTAKKGFRQLFDEYFESIVYKKQIGRYHEFQKSEMAAVDGQVEHPTSQQKILTEVLRDSEMLTDYWDALSHVKNEKTMLCVEETSEFIQLVAFIDQFLEIGNLDKTRDYVGYLIKDLNIMSLIPPKDRKLRTDSAASPIYIKDQKLEGKSNEQTHFEDQDNAISFSATIEENQQSDDDVIPFASPATATFINEDENVKSDDLSSRLLTKLEFSSMMHRQASPVNDKALRDQAKFKFCQQISQQSNLARPIFDLKSGQNEVLRIEKTSLSIAQVQAVAKAMPSMLKLCELHLEDTNLSDSAFAILLQSINDEIMSFKSITYKGINNKFGQKSLDVLQKLLMRQMPVHLTQLSFEGIKMPQSLQANLIQAIARYGLIEKLSLASIKLEVSGMKALCQYLNRNHQLKELDLRNLQMPSRHFAIFLPVLAKNTKLQKVNLSKNQLIDNVADAYDLFDIQGFNQDIADLNNPNPATSTAPKDKKAPPLKEPKKINYKKQIKRRQMEKITQYFVIKHLMKFMEGNENLITLDLTFTGLDEESICEIVSLVKSANDQQLEEPQLLRNLACLHLTAPDENLGLSQLLNDISQILQPDQKIEHDENDQNDRVVKHQQLSALKQPFSAQEKILKNFKSSDASNNASLRSICLQRMLNHEVEFALNRHLVKTHEWQLFVGPDERTCWVCSKAHYTLFFHKVDKQILNSTVNLQLLPDHVNQADHCLLAMTESLTLKMEPIREFCMRIDAYNLKTFDFLHYFREIDALNTKSTLLADLTKEERVQYDKLLEAELNERYAVNWKGVVQRLLDYQYIQVVGDYSTGPNDGNKVLLVTAALLRPGKHQYMIRADESYSSDARAFIARPRTEDPLPHLSHKYLSLTKRDALTKDRSVFRDFKDDSAVHQKQMIDHDFKKWRISRVVKVDFFLKSIQAMIKKKFTKLHALYRILQSASDTYPYISYKVFIDFCKAVFIIEEADRCGSTNMDITQPGKSQQATNVVNKPWHISFNEGQTAMCFANAIWEKERLVGEADLPVGIKSKTERQRLIWEMQIKKLNSITDAYLNRHQFLEVLCLIAIEKYHESQCEMQIHEAVRRLIDQEMLSRVNIQLREKERYSLFYEQDVDLLFKANELQLQHFFSKFTDQEGKYISQARVTNDILGSLFKIGSHQAKILFGRSKMSVANETSSHIDVYRRLQYVELLEIICRVALHVSQQVPHNAKQLPFIKHLELVLDQLLWKVHLNRNCPKLSYMGSVSDSESDEEDLSNNGKKTKAKVKGQQAISKLPKLNILDQESVNDFSSCDLSAESQGEGQGEDGLDENQGAYENYGDTEEY